MFNSNQQEEVKVDALEKNSAAIDASSRARGIDVSNAKGNVDWSAVKHAGIDFAFVKATEGVTFDDPIFTRNWQAMKDVGIIRGAYHFWSWQSDPEEQAEHFVTRVRRLEPSELPPALDIEGTNPGTVPPDAQERDNRIHAFLRKLEDLTGRLPVIYASPVYWQSHIGNSSAFTRYTLWVSHWGAEEPRLPDRWSKWVFWQYTSKGKVDGIVGHVDLDYFNGTPEDLRRWLGVSQRIDVVARGGGDQLYQKYYTRDKGWLNWGNLGAPSGGLTSDPAICSWEPRRWDIFARGPQDQLVHKWFSNDRWSDWEDLGGTLSSGPAAVSWESGRIDVIARGGGNQLYQKYYTRDNGWSNWGNLGAPTGGLTSDPTICSWEPRRLDIFALGVSNQLVHKWFNGSEWSDWEDLGGLLTSAPAAVSWEPGRIDVVARDGGDQLYQKYYRSGVGWSDWINLGAPLGGLTSDPAICSWEPRRLDIFARAANNQLVHKWFNGSEWSDWEDLGGLLTSGPDAIAQR